MKIINKIVVSNLPPKEVNVLWNDTSEDKNGVLKLFVDGEWRKLKAIALDDSIETNMIKDNQITTSKIKDSQITSAKIKDGEVKSGDIASNAVTTAKIKDGNVTYAKLGADVKDKITSKIIIDCTNEAFDNNPFYQFEFADGTMQEKNEGLQQIINEALAGNVIIMVKTGSGLYYPKIGLESIMCTDFSWNETSFNVYKSGFAIVENLEYDEESPEQGNNMSEYYTWIEESHNYITQEALS